MKCFHLSCFYIFFAFGAFVAFGQSVESQEKKEQGPVVPPFPEAKPNQSYQERFDQWLKLLSSKEFFNGAVVVATSNKPLFKGAYGFSDDSQKHELTNRSSFRLASVSKAFTAMAVMLLKEDGQLDFDDPVKKNFPKAKWKEVTIRHLINHTAGFTHYMVDIPQGEYTIKKPLTNQDVVEFYIKNTKKTQWKPGTRYEYSNTGYLLLTAVIEKVSGESFEAFCQERIFDPLKMQDSRVWNLISGTDSFANKVTSMRDVKNRYPGWMDGVAGDGGVFCSINDYVKWDRALRDLSLVSKATWKEALTPPKLPGDQQSDYGFGWRVKGDYLEHGGSWLGARTYVGRSDKDVLLIAVFDSGSNGEILGPIIKQAKAVLNAGMAESE